MAEAGVAAPPARWKVWLVTLRPKTLAAGIAPVLVGWGLAISMGAYRPLPAFAALLAAVFVQIGSNLANDWIDFEKGADNADRIGPARAAQQGWLTLAELKRATALALVLAALVGFGLAVEGGWPVLAIAAASVISAVAYTGGPMPLAYVGLGDLFAWLFFGPVAVMGTVYVQSGAWPVTGLVAGSAVGLLVTGILVVNNLRDRHTDAVVGKRTLAVRLGETAARAEYTLCLLLPFGLLAVGQALDGGRLGWWLPLLALPVAAMRIRDLWTLDGAALNPQLGKTGQLTLLFGVLLGIGLAAT